MNKNKYLLLGSSAGVLALLVAAAVQEHFLREWRRLQWTGRTEEGAIAVQLRQIVNPALGLSDRCVSCHVSMAPGEQSVKGDPLFRPHKPVVHDPSELGCTVCHGGQSFATERDHAHGAVPFWPEPMIPVRYAEAGCGTCHSPLEVPGQETLGRAKAAFERLDCLACHRVDGRGGTIRPGGGGMEGPDLSRTAIAGWDTAWYGKHLEESRKAVSGAWRTSFGPIASPDLALVDVFLATSMGAPKLIEGKAAFHSYGCLGCHKVSGVGGEEGPELTRAGEKDPALADFTHVAGGATLANWFGEHFRSPQAVVAGSQMPPVTGPESDIELLTEYVFSLRRRELPGSYLPKDRVQVTRFDRREFAPDGATLYGAFCSGCHGRDGQGRRTPGVASFPAIANASFLALASDEFLLETVRRGRPGRRMPAWGEMSGGLTGQEVNEVVAYLRRLGGVQYRPDGMPARWVKADAGAGKRLYEAACAGCHGMRGQGGEGPALNNAVLLGSATDSFLVETAGRGRPGTAMGGFLEPSPVRPALSRGEIEAIVAYMRSWQEKAK